MLDNLIVEVKMITDYLYKIITDRRSGFIPTCIKIVLRALSWLYFLALKVYEILNRIGLIRTRELPCRVVSIGNIVVGGTGKTPASIAVAKIIRESGQNPAILLRGYRSDINADWAVVSDGKKTLLSPEQAGDEPYMVADELSGIPVLIGKNRYQTGAEAIKRWEVDTLILDDGFQYRKLKRDADIVVIDATQPFGTGSLLPRGTLREPASALASSDLILVTRINQVANRRRLREGLECYAPDVPIAESIHEPDCLYPIDTHKPIEIEFLKDKRVLAVCGIGNPASFEDTLYSLGVSHVELLAFSDHYQYRADDIKKISEQQTKSDSEVIVTTKKDEQKMLASCQNFNGKSNLPSIYILSIKLKILTGRKSLQTLLKTY